MNAIWAMLLGQVIGFAQVLFIVWLFSKWGSSSDEKTIDGTKM